MSQIPEPPPSVKKLLALHGVDWRDIQEIDIHWSIDGGTHIKVKHKPQLADVIHVSFAVPAPRMRIPNVDDESS